MRESSAPERTEARILASLNAVVFGGAQVLWIALYPFLAERLQLSLSVLIACFAFGSFLFLFGGPYWASKSDQVGRIRILALGSAALFVSLAIPVFLVQYPFESSAVNLFALLMSRAVYGLIASAIAPVTQALQADHASESSATLAKAMMLHSMSLSLGRVVGFLLIVLPVFWQGASIQGVLFLALGLSFVVFLADALRVGRDKKMSSVQETAEKSVGGWRSALTDIKWPAAIAFVYTSFIEALNSVLAGSIQVLFQLEAVLAAQKTAELLLVASIGVVFVQLLGRRLIGDSIKIGLGIGATSLLAGAAIFAKMTSPAGLWVAMALFVVGIGLIPPLYLSLLRTQSAMANGGRRAGLIGSVQTLGYAFGAGVSALALHFDIASGFVLCSITIALTFICLRKSDAVDMAEARAA